MSPLQIQTELRLQEARRLLFGEHRFAASAGYRYRLVIDGIITPVMCRCSTGYSHNLRQKPTISLYSYGGILWEALVAGAEQREQRGSARPGPIFRPVPLDDLLRVVAARRGIDLGAYRGSMVERRTQQRMFLSGVHSYAEYRQRLLADPGEVERLIEHLAIQVSGFFRDPDVWELLREVALADRGRCDPGTPMRVWSAGCGNGEEAYSLAMLLEELALDLRRPHSGVYGTDVERQCLQFARAGRYAEAALQEVAPENRPRYFMEERGATGEAYRVRPNLYARVQFLRHDLTTATAPPAGRQFELICCRNVLIYFQREAAERVQHLLWSSLVPGGYLCLGRSEWLAPALFPAFDIVDRKARLFRRKASAPSGGRP